MTEMPEILTEFFFVLGDWNTARLPDDGFQIGAKRLVRGLQWHALFGGAFGGCDSSPVVQSGEHAQQTGGKLARSMHDRLPSPDLRLRRYWRERNDPLRIRSNHALPQRGRTP